MSVADAQLEDEGVYTCTVENVFGKETYHINVNVTGVGVYTNMNTDFFTSTIFYFNFCRDMRF